MLPKDRMKSLRNAPMNLTSKNSDTLRLHYDLLTVQGVLLRTSRDRGGAEGNFQWRGVTHI